MIVYKCASAYVETFTTLQAKIAAINAIQAALLSQALVAIESGSTNSLSQYSLNNGQTIISASYRSSSEVKKDYQSYEDLKNMLLTAYDNSKGRMVRLVDHKSFPNGW